MKSSKIKLLFLTAISLLIYCCIQRNKDVYDTDVGNKEEAEKHNDAKFSNNAENDAQFLVDAATMNLEEIELGNLALVKGEMQKVRDLGKMLSEEHNKAQSELLKLANAKSISIPSSTPDEFLNNYGILKKEENINFDKLYLNLAANSHKNAIAKFEKASKESEDVDIRAWAFKMLPELRAQLDHAMNCQSLLDSTK